MPNSTPEVDPSPPPPPDNGDSDAPEEEKPTIGARIGGGMKMILWAALLWPFAVVMVPLWFVYAWAEERAGRPRPESPLKSWKNRHKGPEKLILPPEYQYVVEERESGALAGGPMRPHLPTPRPQAAPSGAAAPFVPPDAAALVTGGSGRLGAALARDLAAMGYKTALLYNNSGPDADAVAAGIRESDGIAAAFAYDLNDLEGAEALLDRVEEALGPVRLLVNNAALFTPTHPRESSPEDLRTLLGVNLAGPIWLALRAAERMQRHGGGGVVNVADIWGERPLAGHAVYSASKAGLIMATKGLARDLAPSVRVNAIAPGGVLPPEPGEETAGFQSMMAKTPMAGMAGPEAVLEAVRYLLAAEFVTGEVLHVDGGRLLL